jgi:hypothetical protein
LSRARSGDREKRAYCSINVIQNIKDYYLLMKRLLLYLFPCIIPFFSFSQSSSINEYTTINYKNSFGAGPLLHTNGWGISGKYFLNRSVSKNLCFGLDIISLKHPKETRIIHSIYDDAKPYIYGKLNHIILLKPGLGNQFIIADIERPNGIRINFNFLAGMNIALLKPVYLSILRDNQIAQERYDPEIHESQGDIFGGASFFIGFSEIKTQFGAFGKASLSFEWSKHDDDVKGLETGVMIELFQEELPIFAFIENKQVYINLFLSFYLGKRW